MPGKFVIKKGSTGKFRFNLVGTNGQVIATSEAYESKASAKKGIDSVRRLAAEATLVDETPQRAAKTAATKATSSTKKASRATSSTKKASRATGSTKKATKKSAASSR
jgi:hypothetical protein